MIRAYALPLVIALACAQAATAQDAGARPGASQSPVVSPNIESARKLVEMMQFEQIIDKMFVSMSPMFAQSTIGALQQNSETKAIIEALIANGEGGHPRLVAILADEFLKAIRKQYPSLKERAAQEYAAAFTGEELQQIIAFYQTGAGAKSLRLIPEIQQKMTQAGQEFGRIAGAEGGLKGFERAIEEMLPENEKPKA